MVLICCKAFYALPTFIASVAALRIPHNDLSLFAPSPPSSAYNISSLGVFPATNAEIKCDYGHTLEYGSCLDALLTWKRPFPDRYLTIGQRSTDQRSVDLNLPLRWMSGN